MMERRPVPPRRHLWHAGYSNQQENNGDEGSTQDIMQTTSYQQNSFGLQYAPSNECTHNDTSNERTHVTLIIDQHDNDEATSQHHANGVHSHSVDTVHNSEPPGMSTHDDGTTSNASSESVKYYGLERLLHPFQSVPDIPSLEQLECVYDNEARLLQKLIFRAVKMCTNKSKIKLEEFKINARLYGNGFMDAHEYLNAIATDIGPMETLVITPCMLRLQPDAMKKKNLWLALRAYHATHLPAFQAQIHG